MFSYFIQFTNYNSTDKNLNIYLLKLGNKLQKIVVLWIFNKKFIGLKNPAQGGILNN
jgi:hypothetical protein